MNYYLDKRCEDILKIFIYSNRYVKIEEISSSLSVSKRSVYYDIKKINDWLHYNNIPSLVQERQKGIHLSEEQRIFIQNQFINEASSVQVFTSEERHSIEICELVLRKKDLYIEDFVQICDVSRNTIINDLKQVTLILQPYNLTIAYNIRSGYTIVGDEIKRRALFFLLFPPLWTYYSSRMDEKEKENIEKIINKLKNIENELEAQYVTGILPSLAMFITTIAPKNEYIFFKNMDKEEIVGTKEYQLIDEYFPSLNDNEKLYVTLHLLGSRLQTVPVNIMKEEEQSYDLSTKLVYQFEKIALTKFDNSDALIEAINAHLKSSMYRYRYGIQLGNPMLSDIKSEYSELFTLTKKACKILEEELDFIISDAEIAYLTLHFGAFMIPQKKIDHIFKILIVCNNGVGTGSMIKNEVTALVPQATEITNIPLVDYKSNHNYDIVISTIFFPEEKNLIVVHPILTDQDRVTILRKCLYAEPFTQMQIKDIVDIASKYIPSDMINAFQMDLQQHYSTMRIKNAPQKEYAHGLLHFLDIDHIQVIEKECEWEDAIKESSKPLLMKDFITKSYVDSIIKNQKEKGYHMFLTANLVLAHSSSHDGVKNLSVSMATFKNPVTFLNGRQASIIITLAAENQTKHIHVLNDILKIFSKQRRIQEICSLNTPQEVYDYLSNTLNEIRQNKIAG